MKTLGIMARLLGTTMLVGAIACQCIDYDYKFCESCDALGKVAYKCEYDVTQLYYDQSGVAQFAARHYQLSGCYSDATAAEQACVTACNGFYSCNGLAVEEFYCDGVDDCVESNESATTGAAAPSCADWLPSAEVTMDATTGSYVIGWGFYFSLLSDPTLMGCDATVLTPNATAPGFTIENVQPGSLASALGLQSGDILSSLDRQPLATTDDLAAAAVGLANSTSFELVVVRRGSNLALAYQVQ